MRISAAKGETLVARVLLFPSNKHHLILLIKQRGLYHENRINERIQPSKQK